MPSEFSQDDQQDLVSEYNLFQKHSASSLFTQKGSEGMECLEVCPMGLMIYEQQNFLIPSKIISFLPVLFVTIRISSFIKKK